jgi:hypothetical protein
MMFVRVLLHACTNSIACTVCMLCTCSQKRRRSSSSGVSTAVDGGNDSHDDTRVLRPSQEHLLQAVPAAKVTELHTPSLRQSQCSICAHSSVYERCIFHA